MSGGKLPEGWVDTQLGNIIELKYGKSLAAQTRDGFGFPVYGSNGVVGKHSIPLINKSGLIVGRKGSYGVVNKSAGPFFPIDTTYYIDDFYNQPLEFLFYYLSFLPLTKLNRSTAIPGLNRDDAYDLNIALPPLAEQKIIAEKLDTLLAQVDNTKARLEQIPQILKRFRQAVLTAAVNGLLTEAWRNKVQEPLNLKKINFELILAELRNGLSSKPNEKGLGHPILRISSVRSGHVDQSDIRYLECSEAELERHKLEEGDLLFTRYNGSLEFVGVCGLLKKTQYKDLLYPDKLIRARLTKDALPEYIEIFFSSPAARNAMMECVKTTSGQKGISGKDIKSQLVSLPSLKEQAEIVRRVEQLFAWADTIEKQVNNALTRVNSLTQSILAKAFRGELTAQWRAENPSLISGENSAAALLEKIKAERAASGGKRTSRKKA
ncbi:restriction endonuclease subunit S [Salmonella enterica subsp. enterica]|uniref:Restriction endonuclease subunit S n=2 Tax=Salmonella infantis TaxID=595 RepID=A0A5Y7AG30_SALIN|nr:restriction endonuclease subunit S [Salmonella enterica]ECE0517034.1 restriction endonuclease subunit S [Salmonella enterica subsp. enterica]ECK9501353.1 restriction endonuclease subunit S [Salmonella enterica subsp. enterica serovar Infantis str. CFSAN000522]EDT7328509.1 restriction endonuclease subunit S [Salmonella enterica subsp. enterica]EEA7965149.1 restriction endonuclease subunit S [Salmonella enterica subsp. enterica]EFU9001734.1 restriction endonuclease subunit S [Salmonella enter